MNSLLNTQRVRSAVICTVIGPLACVGGQAGLAQKAYKQHLQNVVLHASELDENRTIANSSDLDGATRKELIRKIADLTRPFVDLEQIGSEDRFEELVAGTRLQLRDLNADGKPEIIAQANDYRLACGATGNCAFWIFERCDSGLKLLLDTRGKDGIGGAESLSIEPSRTHGFYDLVVATHDSGFEKSLGVYRYNGRVYGDSGVCYLALWEFNDGLKARTVDKPLIVNCPK